MKLDRYIDHDWQMTPIDFQVKGQGHDLVRYRKVKLKRKPEGTSDSEEKEEGCITSLTAAVAFTDIKSASKAHKAEKKIGNNVLSNDYSTGFGATGSVLKRTHEPEHFPRGRPEHSREKGFRGSLVRALLPATLFSF
ncbi:hypothetical protein DPMN_066515 [Dreissena polymorpha]|uniref:Uncharacterized protein n=1 Tax=Dreissena polymorpha TaxID=45954 RepID=A0A9D4BV32_DREPO|nr:hypothetical protein DPMN_066515 [Dreissena polymorpha]